MAQQVKELAAKTDHLSSIPGTHMMKEENRFPQLSSDLHMYITTRVCHLRPGKTTTKEV